MTTREKLQKEILKMSSQWHKGCECSNCILTRKTHTRIADKGNIPSLKKLKQYLNKHILDMKETTFKPFKRKPHTRRKNNANKL